MPVDARIADMQREAHEHTVGLWSVLIAERSAAYSILLAGLLGNTKSNAR
jgi:hypothetical protein